MEVKAVYPWGWLLQDAQAETLGWRRGNVGDVWFTSWPHHRSLSERDTVGKERISSFVEWGSLYALSGTAEANECLAHSETLKW